MAVIYTLMGVAYTPVIDPVRGIVLRKAARKRVASPGQMSLFASNEPKQGDTKVENGITYRLNQHSRWERTDRAKGKAEAKPKTVVPVVENTPDQPMPKAEPVEAAGESMGEGAIAPGTKVSIAGAKFDLVSSHADGTVTVKNEMGDAFRTSVGEDYEIVKPKTAVNMALSMDTIRAMPEQDYVQHEVSANQAKSSQALRTAEGAIKDYLRESGKRLPVGINPVQFLKTKRRLSPQEKNLLSDYRFKSSVYSRWHDKDSLDTEKLVLTAQHRAFTGKISTSEIVDVMANPNYGMSLEDKLGSSKPANDRPTTTPAASQAEPEAMPVDEPEALPEPTIGDMLAEQKTQEGGMVDDSKRIELKSYRHKGINAYLIRDGDSMDMAIYGSPVSETDRTRSYKGKLHTVSIDMSTLADGIYRYKEASGANSNKSQYGWIKLKGGEIIDEGTGYPPTPEPSESMPELEGSERQVAWAKSIRSKAIAKHGDNLSEYVDAKTDAKWWIDNRDLLA